MERVVEPELMTEAEQARAYADADFEDAHSRYPLLFRETFPSCPNTGHALDLGCGPGDVTRRFARALPGWMFDAVDGSAAMLAEARRWPAERIRYLEGFISRVHLPRASYDLILSSSLLHHLHDPQSLWKTVRRCAKFGTMTFVVDLARPESREQAQALTDRYAAGEPEVLRRDFYNSLLAAFTPDEVRQQLAESGLNELSVSTISDRHLLICGTLHHV